MYKAHNPINTGDNHNSLLLNFRTFSFSRFTTNVRLGPYYRLKCENNYC